MAAPGPASHAQPWVDKYRPRSIDEVAHQEDVVKALRRALETNNLPHLLFYGPPGTGKTSTALAIARQLYGPDLAKTRVMELNASDERGIGVVRDKIKTFAGASVGAPVPGYPCPPYKLLILDEADAMTTDAQSALRRTMETHSRVTRFVFVCNYVSRIIEPLASRCAKFRFAPLGADAMAARVATVCEAEGVALAPGALTELARVAGGDLRRAITTLQSAVRLKGTPVQAATLFDVAGAVPDAPIAAIVDAARAPAATFAALSDAVTAAADAGWPARGLLLGVQAAVLEGGGEIPAKARAAALTALADADAALVGGADERIQLLAAASAVRTAFKAGVPIVV